MSDSNRTWIEDFEFAAASDIGMRRMNNQDSYVLLPADDEQTWFDRGHLFVVADGMGAHAAGELASKLAADGVAHHYRKLTALSPPEAMLQSMRDTNNEIHQRGQANTEFHNMGTTCSALLLLPQGVLVAHVGDSRVYRIRGNHIEQLTFDHSLVWEMRAAGSLGRSEEINIPKNVITRSLGPQPSVQVDLEGPSEMCVGDRFLICSDGLTARIEDHELGWIVATLTPDEAVRILVDLANLRGGPDNVTVIAVHAKGPAAASNHWRVDPLIVGQVLEPARHVHVAVWIVMAVALLMAAGFCVSDQLFFAIVTGGVALGAGLVAAGQFFRQESGVPLTAGRRLGRAPYSSTRLDASLEAVKKLTRSVQDSLETPDSPLDRDEKGRAIACLEEVISKARDGKIEEAVKLLIAAVGVATRKR